MGIDGYGDCHANDGNGHGHGTWPLATAMAMTHGHWQWPLAIAMAIMTMAMAVMVMRMAMACLGTGSGQNLAAWPWPRHAMALSMHTAGGDASQLGGRLAAATSVAAAAATTAADSGKGLHLEAVPRSAGRTGVGAAPTGEVAEDSRQLVSSQQLLARLYQQAEAMGLDREIIDDALEAFEGSHARVRGCC